MRITTTATAIALTLAAGTMWLAATSDEALADEVASARAAVPDFEAQTVEGEQVRLSDYAGSVVVVNFWATWCDPCQRELPHLQGFHETYGSDGLVVLTINTDGPDTFSAVRSLVRRNRWTMGVGLDQDGSVMSLVNPRGSTPYTMFIDRTGALAFEHEGYSSGDEAEYEQFIQTLLAEPAP